MADAQCETSQRQNLHERPRGLLPAPLLERLRSKFRFKRRCNPSLTEFVALIEQRTVFRHIWG